MLYSQQTYANHSKLKEEDYGIMRKHQLDIEQIISEYQCNQIPYNIFTKIENIQQQLKEISLFIENIMQNYSCADNENRTSSILYSETVVDTCQSVLAIGEDITNLCQKMFTSYEQQLSEVYKLINSTNDRHLLIISYYFGSTKDQELPISSEHLYKIRLASQRTDNPDVQQLLEDIYQHLAQDIISLQDSYCLLKRKLVTLNDDVKRLYIKLSDDE